MLGYMNRRGAGARHSQAASSPSSAGQGNSFGKRARPAATAYSCRGIFTDCDGDALLVLAEPAGPDLPPRNGELLRRLRAQAPAGSRRLSAIVAERARSGDAAELYPQAPRARRGADRARRSARKASRSRSPAVGRDDDGCVDEVADLLYHVSVLMEARGFGWGDVVARLRNRHSTLSK